MKFGDRFYYENENPVAGFTPAQLDSIGTVTMSRVLCGTIGIEFIQKYAFFTANSNWNPFLECKDIPAIDLSFWKDAPWPSPRPAPKLAPAPAPKPAPVPAPEPIPWGYRDENLNILPENWGEKYPDCFGTISSKHRHCKYLLQSRSNSTHH